MKTYRTPQSPYGAFELKRIYQRHMLRGILISSILILAFFYTYGHLDNLQASQYSIRGYLQEGDQVPVYNMGMLKFSTDDKVRLNVCFKVFDQPPERIHSPRPVYMEEEKEKESTTRQ